MASGMQQGCMRSMRRQALKCRVVAEWLDLLPSQSQQQQRLCMFSASTAALDEHPQGTTSARSAPAGPRSALEEEFLPCNPILIPRYGKHDFAVRSFGSGPRFFASDSSVRSSSLTTEALGDVDELNCILGLAHAHCYQAQLTSTLQQIEEIQSRLLDIGSAVAVPLNNPFSNSLKNVPRVKFNAATVEVLESWKAKMDEEVPHQTGFILPSGGLPAASMHVARAVCRRAERRMTTLVEEQVVDESVVRYLNRLSDYLFTAARYAASKLEKPETSWRRNQRR